ncbi:MAG: sensor histidine kinase [Bacillota bacterium]
MSNSIKFTRPGGFIYVNIFERQDKLLISVRDTGIGITEEKQKIVFERFRLVDSTLQREYEGSGIGLSLVKALVESHNGKINLQSEYGKGTEFVTELPVVTLNQDTPANKNHDNGMEKVQKINIEFSDIYSGN